MTPPTQPASHISMLTNRNNGAWRLSTLALAALLASCGGGRESADAAASREQAQAVTNLVVLNTDVSLTTQGRFDSSGGYLSQSARVLRGQGADARATFRIPVPRPGYYEVYAWWPQAMADAGSAQVTVKHAQGSSAVAVDQRVLGGQWNSVGVFAYAAGASAEITLQASGGAPLLVDAVRLHFVGEQAPALQWRTADLPLGLVQGDYSTTLSAVGGRPPYRWAVREGALPAGLVLSDKGVISGRPLQSGASNFTLEVQDAAGATARQALTIEVSDTQGDEAAASGHQPTARNAREQAKALGDVGDLSGLLAQVAAMPEGSWARVNKNAYSSAWAPADLRPLFGSGNPTPSKIILAWSSFAWDSKRGNIVLYGGGHANYRGNDVYIWRGATQTWERGALPSEMKQDSLGSWNAIDGTAYAPASAHTYDNTMYFPGIDRVVVPGGAAEPNGGHYLTMEGAPAGTRRSTGIYLFDPSRADPNKVGGSDNSHVKRVLGPNSTMPGGYMWSNRESFLNAQAGSTPPTEAIVNGCTGVTMENGKDVAYVRTQKNLYRYTIADLANPGADRWQQVGRYYVGGSGPKSTCGLDPERKLFVSTGLNTTGKPFTYWDVSNPNAIANDVPFTPTDPTGEFPQLLASNAFQLSNCGMEFDSVRKRFVLWCGDGRTWTLTPPATPSANGWIIQKQPAPAGAVPTEDIGTGILGKWKYASNLDAFVGLLDPVQGNVWIYKPVGWKNPGGSGANLPPSVTLAQPGTGATFLHGAPITVAASPSDSDGSVAKVEFFANGTLIGRATAAPWSVTWTGAPAGSQSLTAMATDDKGASTTSAPVDILVSTGSVSVTLQRGAASSGPITDTYLSSASGHQSLSFSSISNFIDLQRQYTPLLRFAIFQSEGGPVPNGSLIRSATMSVYKYSSYNMVYALHPLQYDWNEMQATWLVRKAGVPWATAGANSAGGDYATTPDATASTDFNPGWVNFDVTAALARMSTSSPVVNNGWRLLGVSGYTTALKRFYTSDHSDKTLRPKLVVSYENAN